MRRSYTFFPFGTFRRWSEIRPAIMSTARALYVMDTANWQDTIILNGGVRYDGYEPAARRTTRPI